MNAAPLAVLLALAPLSPIQEAVPPDPVAAAQAHLARGDAAAARALLEERLDEDPEDAQAWYLLGHAHLRAGELEEALAAHARAAEFEETAARAAYNAACASARLGRADDAFDWLERAREAGPLDRGAMLADPDLASLRGDERFAPLVPPLLAGAEVFVEDVVVIHELRGEAEGDEYGWVARRLGDLDGDGAQDFGVTAPSKDLGGPQAGRVYAYSGRSGKELFRFDGRPGERLGNSVAAAGDVDGDEVPDVVVGAPGAPGSGAAGRAYLLSGADGRVLRVLEGAPGDGLGLKVHGVGDLDGDGRAEVAVSANQADGEAGEDCGAVLVFSGADGEVLVRLEGERVGDEFGTAVAGSMDADALLAVGARNAGPGGRGRAYLYRLSAEGAERTLRIDAGANGRQLGMYFASFPGDWDGDGVLDVYVSDWNDTTGGPQSGRVVVHSSATGELLLELLGQRPREGFGTSPSDAGDLDGDGLGDLAVGAWQNSDAAPSGGRVYVHAGGSGELLATYTSRQAGDTLGFDSVGLGDVDGDGRGDLLVTSAWSAVHGPRTGRVFVVRGPVAATSD